MARRERIHGLANLFAAAVCFVAGCQDMAWNGGSKSAIDPQRARVDARTVLLQSVHSGDPLIRTHAVEAIGRTMGAGEGRSLLQGLSDPAVSVRYAAAMAVGDVSYRPARARLLEIVKNSQSDQRVVAAAIYALHRMGDDTYTEQLATLLHSEFDEGRASAAMVMGNMGEPSAIDVLKSVLSDEKTPAVRLALVEALARLGDTPSAQMLESYAKQYFLDLRLAVIPAIGELRVQGAHRILKNLLVNSKNPPRVRVAAAGALGTLGRYEKEGYQLAQSALENPDALLQNFYGPKHAITDVERSSLQQLGALALGKMDNDQALAVLHPFLQEHDPAVRVAAAMATLQLLSPQPLETHYDTPAPKGESDDTSTRKLPRIQTSEGMDELDAK
ncbi:MAG: HEAT repeat domain-containing protein [Phycisphaerae bacterium]|nr:HEAT repeat domain-containing protein [Phycisphaerae bacterium]